MFRIHDYELTESELAIFESTATIAPDHHISFPGQSRAIERRTFNLCEILLQWALPEEFGIQRIRLGVNRPLTKALWARKLNRVTRANPKSLYDLCVWSRKISIRAAFPSDAVKFRPLGWRLMNVDYWQPGNAVCIADPSEAKVTRVMVRCSEKSMSQRGAKLQ